MTKWKTYQPFIYRDKRTYHWRTDGSRWELVAGSRAIATVVPDEKYAGMWRIDLGDGALSDMVNLSRAKEAAVRLADASQEAGKPLLRASSMRQNESPATLVPSDSENAPEPAA